jgi:hypothetical protein
VLRENSTLSTTRPDFHEYVLGGLTGRDVQHTNVEVEVGTGLVFTKILTNVVISEIIWT